MNLAGMYTLVSQRLNEGQTGFVSYPKAEIIAALNEAERTFVLLTLGLEITSPWTVPGATPAAQNTFFRMLSVFSDWICPLRISTVAGGKVRPSRLDDLASLDSQWMTSVGAPTRYAAVGVDLVALYRQPAAPTVLNVTYARAAVALVNDADAPEIPAEYHPALVSYAIYRMRQGEGAQEFEKALPLLGEFMASATKYAAYVRSRNLGGRYDKVPIELEKLDISGLLKLRKDLIPERRGVNG